jgi:vacuolar-type H+-ATPase catalytic subunit A/Vma1
MINLFVVFFLSMPDPFANLWKQAVTQHTALRQSAARQSAKRSMARLKNLKKTKTMMAQHMKTTRELLNKIRQAKITAAKLAAVRKLRQSR